MTRDWHRHAPAVLFVVTEAVAWFAVLRGFATGVERGAFRTLAREIDRGLQTGAFENADRAEDAFAIAAIASREVSSGAPLLVVVAAALGAFALVRSIGRLGFPAPIAALVGLAASMLALYVLAHVTIAGNLWLWDSSAGLGGLAEPGQAPFGGRIDGPAFVADPDPNRVARAAHAVTLGGLVVIWTRFLIAGRGAVTYERVLRSFGVGFGLLLLATFVVRAGDGGDNSGWLLVYFVLGVLSLAVAQAARGGGDLQWGRRTAPWLASVLLTLGALSLAALLFGTLALLDVDRIFRPVIDALAFVIARLLMLLIAPIFFAIDWLLHLVLGDPPEFRQRVSEVSDETFQRRRDGGGSPFPGWVLDAVRLFLVAFAVWVTYRIARMVFGRIRRPGAFEEYREGAESEGSQPRGGLGLGGLWRGRRAANTEWLRRHRVYRLYADAVQAAQARGVEREPGQTPLEFARAAATALEAPPFERIAQAFDGARYGRHYPPPDEVARLERQLADWERQHPLGGLR